MTRTVCHWLCLAAIPATLLLAGCSTPIARSVVQANLAQEQAANQLLLLNIARAHERMPMHFSQIGQIRAAPGGWGLGLPSLGLELPFGGEASRAYTLTAGNEGQTPVDVSALYNQEFMRGITTPVTADTVAYFANQGWPTAMLMHLFFESITTVGADDKVIDRIVNNPGGPGYGRFRDVVKNAAGCELAADQDSLAPRFLSSTLTAVDARSAVEIGKADQRLVPVTPAGQPLTGKDMAQTHFRVASISKEAVLRLQPPPESAGAAQKAACKPADASDSAAALKLYPNSIARRLLAGGNAQNLPVHIYTLRSPEATLYYLGQLSRAQNRKWPGSAGGDGHSWPLTIPLEDGRDATLFDMTDQGDANTAAVAVAYGGTTFAVGRADARSGDAKPDRSTTVLALMQLLLGLQDKGTEAPSASSVRLVR